VHTHRDNEANAGTGHPLVHRFLDLKRGKGQRGDPGIALEGLWALRAASSAGLAFEAVFVCPELLRGIEGPRIVERLQEEGATVLRVSERVLRRMAERDGPDGLAGVALQRPARLADVVVASDTRVVVTDRCELVGNLGTLVRCADGAGAAAVLAVDCPFRLSHPLLVKASMGTVFTTPVIAIGRSEATAWLRRQGFRVVAADPAAQVSYRDAEYGAPVAIVLGNERHGLAPEWIAEADLRVSIPMLGVADSLNVGHAAALLLYEALRQVAG
jgi:TrmH family RNA methyltransferase